MKEKAKADYLFEASWEVCNKVGGIYTVVKSKAYAMKELYKHYFLVGPYFEDKAVGEFKEKTLPEYLKKAFDIVEKDGIKCHYGTWDVGGSPDAILIEFASLIKSKDAIKSELWEAQKIDSLGTNWEFEEPMLWSWAVGMLLCEIEKQIPNEKIVGHFHEWLAGFAIFNLKLCKSNIKTVFTTHATMLGRTIAGSGQDLYNILDNINPEEEAYKHGIQAKFLTERCAANQAEVFTTVSEITAIEAEKLLGRKPDVILNNGLTMSNFPTIEETSMKHLTTRERIREFLTVHFFPYYKMELEHNLIYFIVGRYEFKNKGLDVLIKALGRLNEQLKKDGGVRTVTVFFWIPTETHGIKIEELENKNYYRHIKDYVQLHSKRILDKMVKDIVTSTTPTVKGVFTERFLSDLEKDFIKFKRKGNPLMLTHNIPDERADSMLSLMREVGLDNEKEDKVKAIVFPVYLDGNDGLLNLSYYDAISGSHLGLFPSYYEPWGYTPLETSAMGVASLTTDLAGFGRFIEKQTSKDKLKGIYTLKRYNRSEEEVINDLFQIMYDFSKLNHEERVKNKIVAKNLADKADWSNFVCNYVEAHNKALDN